MNEQVLSQATQLEHTRHCIRCGYDVRGIDDDRACPECGLEIVLIKKYQSIGDLNWAKNVRRGAILMKWGLIVFGVGLLAMVAANCWPITWVAWLFVLGLFVFGGILTAIGAWMLATPSSYLDGIKSYWIWCVRGGMIGFMFLVAVVIGGGAWGATFGLGIGILVGVWFGGAFAIVSFSNVLAGIFYEASSDGDGVDVQIYGYCLAAVWVLMPVFGAVCAAMSGWLGMLVVLAICLIVVYVRLLQNLIKVQNAFSVMNPKSKKFELRLMQKI